MIEFFKSGSMPPATAIAVPPSPTDDQSGIVRPKFDEGSVLVKDAAGKHYRLVWRAQDKDRRRGLPPGAYTLTHFDIVRRDEHKTEWFISGSGAALAKLKVAAGQDQTLGADDAVMIQCKAKPSAGTVDIQATVMDGHHHGLSIYRDGKRIPLKYRVADARGKELATGELEYG